MDLSIIIPVYNESKKIAEDIKKAEEYILNSRLKGEIIIVDDGSRDQTAKAVLDTKVSSLVEKKLISYNNNRGKGFAVRKGIIESIGEIVMFADSGNCIPYSCADYAIDCIRQSKALIANGSRKLKASIIKKPQPWQRILISKAFRLFVIVLMKVPSCLTDTQCGFKVYNGRIARELYEQCISTGFTFDVEIILRAIKKGYEIIEFPVEWSSDPDSRVLPIRMSLKVLNEFIEMKKEFNKIISK